MSEMDLFFSESRRRRGPLMPVALSRLLLLTLVGFLGLPMHGVVAVESDSLGAAGRKAYEQHHYFFNEIVPSYPVETKVQVNAGFKALTHLTFSDESFVVEGAYEVPVPVALNPYIFDFRTIEIVGSGLKKISRISADSDQSSGVVVITSQQDKRIQITASSVMADMGNPFSLMLEGEGRVDQVQLVNYEGISFEFDASAYQEPGLDRPIKRVGLQVDATRYRSIEGICELQPERYFRYYAAPNADRSGMEPYFREKGFLPGRQILEIGPAYEDRYGAAEHMVHLKEDETRAGFAEPSSFERREFRRFEGVDPSLEFVMCLDTWPRFMWPTNLSGVPNQRGTPAVEYFDAAADVAARLIQSQIRDSGRTATWWEVKNESDVKSEWLYHHQPHYDSWKLLADFHNQTARAIHDVAPQVNVGGPASAWLQPHRGQFEVWRNHVRFMELTRADLDYYSLHFYEMGAMDSMQRWRNGSDSYVQGGQASLLNMLQAYMAVSGNKKPLVCSEYGTLDVKRGERGWWMHIKNANAMLVGFLNRPNEFSITVPFLLSYMHWAPDSSEAMIHRTPDGEFVKTKNTYWLDMWEGYHGERIPVSMGTDRVFSHAVLDDRIIRLAVNNATAHRVLLDVSTQLPVDVKVVSCRRRAVVFEQGETRYLSEPLDELSAVPLGVDGTCILEIELDQELTLEKQLHEQAFFAPEIAVEIEENTPFHIEVPVQPYEAASLHVGLYKEGGFAEPISIEFNGEIQQINVQWSAGIPRYLDMITVPLSTEWIEAENQIRILTDALGVTVTSLKLVVSIEESMPSMGMASEK